MGIWLRLLILALICLTACIPRHDGGLDFPVVSKPLILDVKFHIAKSKSDFDYLTFITSQINTTNNILIEINVLLNIVYNEKQILQYNLTHFFDYRARDTQFIHIIFVDSIQEVSNDKSFTTVGLYHDSGYCNKIIFLTSESYPLTLAHEVGHFVGFNHDDQEVDNMNIMFSPASDRDENAKFTVNQYKALKIGMAKYQKRCLSQ
jgi:hypothetical protein